MMRDPALVDRRRAVRPRGGGRAGAGAGGRVRRGGRRAPARPPRPRAARTGSVVFAIDTELLGHWWWEGPVWLERGARARAGARRPPRPRSTRRSPSTRPSRGRSHRSTWGEDKDLSTWDSPAVADLAWGARRLELRLLREPLRTGLAGTRPSAPRASCSRSRRATGRSSTTAGRRVTTPTSGPSATPGRCSRP